VHTRQKERRRDPSVALGALTLVAALGFVGYRSPQPWTAAGLICVTASACIASPELIRGFLHVGTTRAVTFAGAAVGRLLRIVWSVVIGVMILLVVLLAAVGDPRTQAITAGVFALIMIGFGEFFAWQMRYLFSELLGGGRVDREIARRWAHRRWPLAGLLFVAGTLLQLAGTFFD